MAPPNTPVLAQYVPLRQLFEAIKTGQRFRPVTIQEIARFREVLSQDHSIPLCSSLLRLIHRRKRDEQPERLKNENENENDAIEDLGR